MTGNYRVKTGPPEWGEQCLDHQSDFQPRTLLPPMHFMTVFPQRGRPGLTQSHSHSHEPVTSRDWVCLGARDFAFFLSFFPLFLFLHFVSLNMHSTSLQQELRPGAGLFPSFSASVWVRWEGGACGGECEFPLPPNEAPFSRPSPQSRAGAGRGPQLGVALSLPRRAAGVQVPPWPRRCPPRLTNCSVRATPASLSLSTKVISQ